jgi:predicted nucleic acid-binding protein
VTRRRFVDAGPLVAVLNERDRFHDWTKEQMREADAPLLTCEAAIAEACSILRGTDGAGEALLELVRDEYLAIPYRIEDDAGSIAKLMRRYANVPMSLADACLVQMAEMAPRIPVLTLDRDFRIYRLSRGRPLATILPE